MKKKVVFEYWTELINEYGFSSKMALVHDALVWTGKETSSNWQEHQETLSEWFDEYLNS